MQGGDATSADRTSAFRCRRGGGKLLLLAGQGWLCYSLNQMVQYNTQPVDATFAALSDATRRGVLERLMRADASISDLAQHSGMTLTGMKKHISVLEQAGLVTTRKLGRVRTCRLGPSRLDAELAWLQTYRSLWAARFAGLDAVVQDLLQQEMNDDTDRAE